MSGGLRSWVYYLEKEFTMNQEHTVQLWTWHKPDFSLTSGRVYHSRSSYYQTIDTIPPAYEILASHIGTDQIIWCYSHPGKRIIIPGNPCVEWVLDVPSDKVLAIIDTWVPGFVQVAPIQPINAFLKNQWNAKLVSESEN
jgi:hypothetical protein